jgi:hypothetical protein
MVNKRVYPLRVLKNSEINIFDCFFKHQVDTWKGSYELGHYNDVGPFFKQIYFKEGNFITKKNNGPEEVDPQRNLVGVISEERIVNYGGFVKFCDDNAPFNKKTRSYENKFSNLENVLTTIFKDNDYLVTEKNGDYRIEGKIIL